MSLRSRPYDTFITRPLTDRAIDNYMRQGRCGPAAQARILARDAARKRTRLDRKPKTPELNLEELSEL